MTREEEIKKRAKECFDEPIEQALFWKGAEWADQHPRKGLWDAEKVCAWIGIHLLPSCQGYILEDLRKAMED